MKESSLWREIARKMAEADFPPPTMCSPDNMFLGNAIDSMLNERQISYDETGQAFKRIMRHHGEDLGPGNSNEVNVLAALMLSLEAEDEGL